MEWNTLSDNDLVERVKELAVCERRASVALIRSLVQFDTRRLYLREGCSSLFTYCVQVLHLSEGSAYNRIETARAARRYPRILPALERGDLTLTSIRLLAPHLTDGNYAEVLGAARHRSKQGIQELIASLSPRAAAATMIRQLTGPAPKVEARTQSGPPTTVASSSDDRHHPPGAPGRPADIPQSTSQPVARHASVLRERCEGDTYPPPSGGASGTGTMDDARLSAPPAGAGRLRSWSFITSTRTRPAGQRR